MKIAIMQPYVFPYIGYFQLINAVDTFVFYDDVNFIKKGFINRNNILVNGTKNRFTIPCKSISQNKLINEIQLDFDAIAKTKFLKSLQLAYSKAPFYNDVFPLIKKFMEETKSKTISEFAIESIKLVSDYLSIKKEWNVSSMSHQDSKDMEKEQRLIYITLKEKALVYINPIGGTELYKKSNFSNQNIELLFLKSTPISYKQFDNDYVPWLSVLDVLMFNTLPQIKSMINNCELL